MDQTVEFDRELLERYNATGPRYTSYPTANRFHDAFGAEELARSARWSNEDLIPNPLSLYVHIPFCETVCFYCGCNKIPTKDHSKSVPYLEALHKEAALLEDFFDMDRRVEQMHWGGGTPTFLGTRQMKELMFFIRSNFNLRDDDRGEYSIEIDPRDADEAMIAMLREIGFNRLSFGIQDFNEKVQEAVNRVQPLEQTMNAYKAAREHGFHSVNFDLIYGLPFQSMDSFGTTVEMVIDARPDRIAVFNYAHLPHLFKPQRRINEADLPPPEEKLGILQQTIEQLTAAGYVYIGLDHFALPEDELAQAQLNGTLYRNFQGFSAHSECDLIALGVSSIGKVGDCYYQNERSIDAYYAALERGQLPVARGVQLTADDIIRRDVINSLICYSHLDFARMEEKYGLEFEDYFAEELERLKEPLVDGLVSLQDRVITVNPRGKLLVRNVAMIFDLYLRDAGDTVTRFSRVI